MQEIKDAIDSYSRTEQRKKTERVSEIFVLATVTANRVICGMNGKSTESDLLMPWDFYPDLFEDKSEELEGRQTLIETERLKAQMNRRIAAWNARFEKENQDGPGKIDGQSNGGDDGRPNEAEKDS